MIIRWASYRLGMPAIDPAYSGPMRAARLHSIGGTLQLDELPDPEPGPGEKLVDIAYASVNPLDVWITQGSVGAAAANLPWIPGTEASGHVDGRPVLVRGGGLGVVRPGTYCSKMAVPDGLAARGLRRARSRPGRGDARGRHHRVDVRCTVVPNSARSIAC